MTRTFTPHVVSVAAALALLVGGLVAPAPTLAGRPDRGIVCPRGQHAYHAPGGAVTCIPNGQSTPTPSPSVPTS
jgi:hypothetical protein